MGPHIQRALSGLSQLEAILEMTQALMVTLRPMDEIVN